MKIRRTYGATMREALAQVKLEQGPDAVILGNKKVPGGVEILSAIDFDQSQLDQYVAKDQQQAQRDQQARHDHQAQREQLAARAAQAQQPRQPEPALRAAAIEQEATPSVPDFILKQTSEERREPVLGWPESERQTATAQADVHARDHLSQASRLRAAPRQGAGEQNSAAARAASRPVVNSESSPTVNRRDVQSRAGMSAAAPKQAPVKREARSSESSEFRDRPPFGGESPERVNRYRALPVEEEAMARQTQADSLLRDLRDNPYQRDSGPVSGRPAIDEVKDELRNLRALMTSQLNVLEWDRFAERNPVRSVLLNLMSEMGLGTDVTEMVFNNLGQINDDPHKVWQQALGLVARAIPIASSDILSSGGRIALVGSTGVGKTTTIAKMAARFAHKYGKHSVALVTTDNFRIGAHEQLQQFARMLEIPLLTANTAEELTDRLKMLADKRLVLIDTAGMSQNDVRLSEQFHKLQTGSPEIRPYLVLSANTQLAALSETVRNFKKVKLGGAIVTKLDESASLGGVITAAIRHQLPLTYVGTGQQVPEDLHQAKSHRLVSKAVSLMQSHAENCDPETLAFRFNHLISQPHG